MKVFGLIIGFLLLVGPRAQAFNDGYQCTAVTETSVGYAPGSNKIDTGGGNVKRPYTLRLSGVVSDRPALHAQDIVPLLKLGEAYNIIWFVEKASAGTIITWTLFEKDSIRPATLISTKSYDLAGAAFSIIAALGGTYLLAFGLKIQPGISDDLRKELKIEEKGLVSPSDVQQRGAFVVWGLVLVTIAALLQLWLILYS